MNAQIMLKKLFLNRRWRLTSWRLYHIKDKDGKKIPFIPNQIQQDFLQNLRYKNIILKARQMGFTTMIDMILLDSCLFEQNKNIGIIAQDLDSAESLFQDKIKFARDNLPPFVKNFFRLKTDRTRELAFENNGSRISVWTSFRWGTYQYLHISEFGKICNKYPDKAREIMTGALNTVSSDNYVFVESTAEWNSGYFFEMCRDSENLKLSNKTLTKLDYKFHFYPWYKCTDYVLEDNVLVSSHMQNYFQTLESQNISLTQPQKNRYTKTSQIQKEEMLREYPSLTTECFNIALKWAYYETYLNEIRKSNRLCKVDYDMSLPVHTAWDLWGAWWWDDTSIWFFQIWGEEIRLIDFWSGNGYSLKEIISNIVFLKPYKYWMHIAPHDIRVHEYSTGTTRFETALQMWIKFCIAPNISISDGINQVRNILHRCWFDEVKTIKWFDALWNYIREFDEKNWMFREKPLHNWASNPADAFRYLAIFFEKINIKLDFRPIVQSYNL